MPRKQAEKVQTVRLPFIGSMTNRDYTSNKDQRFVNIFPETRKVDAIESTKIFLNKRPGLSQHRYYGSGEGRSASFFNGKIYVTVGNTVYEDGTTPVAKITLGTSTGKVGTVVCNSSTLGDYLFICDGVDGWIIKSDGTAVAVPKTPVRTINVTAGGTGYTTTPTVDVGAAWVTATSYSSGDQVYNGNYLYTATSSGTSGGTAPVHTSGSVSDGGVTWAYAGPCAKGIATISGGAVTAITVSVHGDGYTTAPAITITGGGGSSATATAVLGAFPTPHQPSPTFLDGYVIIAKGSDVYNSELDDPLNWDTSNYLTAEMYPDPVSALARQNNQIAVLGGTSIEFFYDAANASGSPLSRNDSTVIQMGTCSPHCIYQAERTMIYIAQSDSGGRGVWLVDGFQPKKVSDEFIDRILDKETNISNAHGYGIRTMGHLFFVINLTGLGRTLVYDTEEKLWHEWATNVGGTNGVFKYNHMCDPGDGSGYLLHVSNGTVCKLDVTKTNDNDVSMITEIVTNRYDMDSMKRKFMHNYRIVGDRYPNNSVDLRWSDDDYQTWSNWKTISLSDDFPSFARLGSFRRRAFNIRHELDQPLRMESFEVIYIEGDT